MKLKSLLFSLLLLGGYDIQVSAQEGKPEGNIKSLFAVESDTDLSKLKPREASVSLSEGSGQKYLKIDFKASEKYPDVQFSPPSGTWDLSGYAGIRAEITNAGKNLEKISIRVDNQGTPAEKKWITGGDKLAPGETRVFEVIFGESKGKQAQYALDRAAIIAIHVFLAQPKEDGVLIVKSIQAFGGSTAEKGAPIVKAASEPKGTGAAVGPTVKNEPWTKPELFNFAEPDAISRITGLDSKQEFIEVNGQKALRVTTGFAKPFPNVAFNAANGSWNLEAYNQIEIGITNKSQESLQINGRVDNPGATGKSNSNGGKLSLDPGESGTLTVTFNRYFAEKLREKLAGMRYTPWGVRSQYGPMIDPSNIVQVSLFLNTPAKPYEFTVNSIKAVGAFDASTQVIPEPFFPFIDRYGQYIHKDWLGKVKSNDDFAREKALELKYINTNPRPSSWNRYGGWADGPQLKATGHFYTAKHEGKWHLVDPEGRLFFSMGIDVVQTKNGTPIDHRDGWFADAPWEHEKGFSELVTTVKETAVQHGEYKGQKIRSFNFFGANLQRKYGADWENTWCDLMPKRLMNWGFNTIGNWSDPKILKKGGIPYTHWVFHRSPSLPWQANTRNPIADPFHPTFEEEIRKNAVQFTSESLEDPFCIGYFVDNELSWRDDTFQAKAAMVGDASKPVKVELIKELQASYGKIEKLNAAWGTSYSQWEKMLGAKEIPTTDAAVKDLRDFNAKIARKYFEIVSKVMKEVAPKKLYLGCRFADHNAQVVKISAEYCDVVSFNIYRDTVAGWKPVAEIDKPVIIGEFHFGATDRGVFGPGLAKAKDAADRAVKFARYVTGAASNPLIVGAHWFALVDEPTSGRVSDCENYGFGFLSITDTPYLEMVEASRKLAQEIYVKRSK